MGVEYNARYAIWSHRLLPLPKTVWSVSSRTLVWNLFECVIRVLTCPLTVSLDFLFSFFLYFAALANHDVFYEVYIHVERHELHQC